MLSVGEKGEEKFICYTVLYLRLSHMQIKTAKLICFYIVDQEPTVTGKYPRQVKHK